MTRVFVTGAGGPAALAFMRAMDAHIELFAGDTDPYAAGLYLVPDGHRFLLRRGDDPAFIDAMVSLCAEHRIELLVPTMDSELAPIAATRSAFEAVGTRVLVASAKTLAMSLDKATLIDMCRDVCPVPDTRVLGEGFDVDGWRFPILVKPRRGAGGRGVRIIPDAAALMALPWTGELVVQEYLSGAEYSVDVLADRSGRILATVPRERLKIDAGVAVTARTFHDADLQRYATAVAERIGLTFVGNVQFRRDAEGVPRLLEVSVRLSGTMSLTVASGVNMPRLAMELALSHAIPAKVSTFRDMAVVRYLDDRFFDPQTLEAMEQLHLRALAGGAPIGWGGSSVDQHGPSPAVSDVLSSH